MYHEKAAVSFETAAFQSVIKVSILECHCHERNVEAFVRVGATLAVVPVVEDYGRSLRFRGGFTVKIARSEATWQ